MTKKETTKTAVTKVAKKKDPSKSSAAKGKAKNDEKSKAKGGTKNPGSMMRDLLLERKYTDEEIFQKVSKAFPEKKVLQTYCNNWRHWINKLSGMESVKKSPIERLFNIDGKLVPKSERPASPRTVRKKYTEDNDPLKKIAGIDVHTEKKQATKKVVKTVAKKVAKKLNPEKSTSDKPTA